MIPQITFSKKTMATHGTLVVSIPPEIIEDMNLADCEMVEVRLTKKPHSQTTTHLPEHPIRAHVAYIPTDAGVGEVFR
jgi:hypothetical protein